MGAQQHVEPLVVAIGRIPVGLTLCVHVDTHGQAVQHRTVHVEAIVGIGCQRVLRNEGHILAGIVDGRRLAVYAYAVHILLELSAGIAVADPPVQMVVESATTQCCLHTAAVALAGIHHGTAKAILCGKDGQLLVANLHIVGTEVEVQDIVEEVQVGTYLIVPRLFGTVLNGVADVVVALLVVGNLHVATY